MFLRKSPFILNRFSLNLFFILLLTTLPAACSFGPKQLKDGHLAYNETVRMSSDQELLLNIVRLRYLDTIEFMSISSISSQLSFSVTVGARAGEEFDQSTSLAFGEAAWSNRPTFTFIPQRGKTFAKMVTTPVPLTFLTGLAAADWDITVLFQLMIQDINGNENTVGFISPEFLEITQLLDDLQLREDLYFGSIEVREKISDPIAAEFVSGTDLIEAAKEGYRFVLNDSGESYFLTQTLNRPVLYIPAEAPERKKLFNILHLQNQKNPYIKLRYGYYPEEKLEESDFIDMDTRSILDTIAYLARSVEVPESHITKGWATKDWPVKVRSPNDLKGLLKIHVSESRPEDTLAIQHRGYWFYLADNDVRSKMTFLTLAEIMRLALSPEEDAKTPVLTLPVGR